MNCLVFVAHCDDETLGAGAAIWQLVQQGAHVTVVFANDGIPQRDGFDYSLRDEAHAAAAVLGVQDVRFLGFPDQRLDVVPCAVIVDKLRALELPPCEILFTHSPHDSNVDHFQVYRAALVYGRPIGDRKAKMIVACEVLSSSEWGAFPFAPNWWVPLSEGAVEAKLQALECYEKEMRDAPHPRSYWAVRNKMQTRGAECCAEYAEAFQILKCYKEVEV